MRRAQSTIEYIMVIGVLAASLIAMGAYMKRGFHGNVRNMADQLGSQYEPGKTAIDYEETLTSVSEETTIGQVVDGVTDSQTSSSESEQSVSRQSTEVVGGL
jgi:hypothetical protein